MLKRVERSFRSTSTLVVHSGGLGDFLLFCPSLKRLAEEGPVTLAGSDRDRLNLAVVYGIAETAHHLDDLDFGSIFTAPSERLLRFFAKFDRVIVWMNDDSGHIQGALSEAGVLEALVRPGLPPQDWNRHAADYYAEQLGLHHLPPLTMTFDTDGADHDVLIHPGSGGKRKNWPLDNFQAIASAVEKNGHRVEWLRGPAEETLDLAGTVLEPASVVTLARHLCATRVYIGNDSGVTHLAAACGCQTIAVFGPTDPTVWAPRGDNVVVCRSEPWPTVNVVLAAVDRTIRRLEGNHR